jgi:hypothetical protein
MNKMKLFLCLSVIFLSLSCSTHQVEKKITGMWVIDEVIFENESYPKGNGILLLNVLVLDENNKCRLPGQLYSRQEAYGTWMVYEKNGAFFLRIEHCNDDFFNTDYKIIFQKDNERQISFVSEKIVYHCRQVQILP